MSELSLTSLVKSIKDGQDAVVNLLTKDGKRVALDCVYKESIAPNFFIVLPSGEFPKNIDQSAPSTLSIIDKSHNNFILTAKFAEQVNRRTIELAAAKSIDPISLREYFRVDFRTDITLSDTSKPNRSQNWTLHGQTLDLSATGVLGIFPEECKKISNINIEIKLVNPKKKIQCIGHVVRNLRTRSGRFHAALHFDQITNESRDDIITNCLWEQRRQLRENIRTAE